MTKAAMAAWVCLTASPTMAAAGHTCGTLVDLTSFNAGVLIRIDAPLPDNCANAVSTWMLIPEARQAMTATLLGHWLAQRHAACIYTDPAPGPASYCTVIQYDPQN